MDNEVKEYLKNNKSVSDNFLDYDRRAKEGEFLLNQYFNNPKLSTLCKYLWFNFIATCNYLYRYRKISNLLHKDKSNKIILSIKHIIYITHIFLKMFIASLVIFIMRLATSLIKLLFYIIELILFLITSIFFFKDIEWINRKFNKFKKEDKNSNNNNSKINRYWRNIKWYFKNIAGYLKYISAKIIGKINTSKKITKPVLNLDLLKNKKISFMKKTLIRARNWTKLKMFNLKLINIIDNNKNNIRKRNAKNQLKYVRKVLNDKGKNTKKQKNIKIKDKAKNKTKTKAKEKIEKPQKSNKNFFEKFKIIKPITTIKDKLVEKVTELTKKITKLENLGEKILFETLTIKTTKSFLKENDTKTNLTKSQKVKFDKYVKIKEEEKPIKIKEKTKENVKDVNNNNEKLKNEVKRTGEVKNKIKIDKINYKAKQEFTSLEQQTIESVLNNNSNFLTLEEDEDLLDQIIADENKSQKNNQQETREQDKNNNSKKQKWREKLDESRSVDKQDEHSFGL